MGFRNRRYSDVSGRKFIVALGGIFVALVVSYPFLPIVNDSSSELWVVLGILVGIPGLVLLYGGYRLPQTDIRSELYPTVGKWCLRGIVVGFAIMLPIVLASDDPNIVGNTLLLTALGSLAGFGAGMYDAQAKTRQLELQETIDQLETSNERLERHQQYTDDILDAIDDVFYVVDENGSLERWNQSLLEVSGYTAEEISSMTAADFFRSDDRDAAMDAVRKGFESGSVDVELKLRTKDGDTVPFEFVGSTLKNTSGDPVLAGIGRDVSDRVEREQRLEESNERLEQFAYAASHDLQEPLRMVSSYLRLIEDRADEELTEETEEFLEFAVDGADRMRDMIDGLLAYSRIETQGEELEPVDLNEVIRDVRDDLEMRITESDADVNIEELPRVVGDKHQLHQLFQNLLSNAIEYSGNEPPQVQISATQTDSMWEISVQDEGIGIEPDEQGRIFEVFQRLHSRNDHEGSGIGLAVCERIVERHGGEIWVESEPGEGATFSFTLPAEDEYDR
ncbi:sensor histidine kinase [Halopiger xanaduensis]|uniref:histidine kinase n=1 Tax=Halopiger xanaduensis (strain DSM 18323 / JCM 14033 / SH-6) TaxID=797210 RepID=F8DE32_HALXS|nr:ATP-binding protein [Halopiger xanaduensis]AEH39308.1 multi-sensor signal transduction histidine kinase [Halopiger xanaduensis SH-6]